MAEKKATQKKKKTSSTPKKIKLTYKPIGFRGAPSISFLLREKDAKGRNKPLIKGLPMDFVVQKGEVVEVTQKQLEELEAEGCVETEQEYQERLKFIKGMKDQYPKTFSDLEIAERNGDLISSQESQRMIYNDKLIRCD